MEICILQLGTFGDMILCTPIISALKSKFPDSNIYFIAGKKNHIIIKYHPYIKKIFVWDKNPLKLLQTIIALKSKHFNFFVDPKDHFSRESKIIARMVKANSKIGLNTHNSNVFDTTIPDETQNLGLHFTQRIFKAFDFLNINFPDKIIPPPELFYPESSKFHFQKFLNENKLSQGKYIVFNISASHPRKTFSERALEEIFSKVHFYLPIVICFDKKDTQKAKKILHIKPSALLFYSKSILDIFPLVENCKAVITPDTSIVHIATAYKKNTLAFYSGLDNFFNKFHPNNPNAVVVRARSGDYGIQSIQPNQFIISINLFVEQIMEIL